MTFRQLRGNSTPLCLPESEGSILVLPHFLRQGQTFALNEATVLHGESTTSIKAAEKGVFSFQTHCFAVCETLKGDLAKAA